MRFSRATPRLRWLQLTAWTIYPDSFVGRILVKQGEHMLRDKRVDAVTVGELGTVHVRAEKRLFMARNSKPPWAEMG